MLKSRICAVFAILFFLPLMAHSLPVQGEGIDRESDQVIAEKKKAIEREFSNAVLPEMLNSQARLITLKKYEHLDPKHEVPADLLQQALLYFDANSSRFSNRNYLTVVDFRPRSDKYRFFLVNLNSGEVEKFHTTHGIGSDANKDGYANTFGNEPNSGKSSLGYVRVSETYEGNYGYAVRLDGLSNSNSNMRDRAVVFHGWDHVVEENKIQGLTWGCITMDWRFKDATVNKIRNGSLMYVGVSKKTY